MSNRLRIGISQGDINGIGWEVILKIFSDMRLTELFTPVVYGTASAAAFYQRVLTDYEPVKFHIVEGASRAQAGRVNLVECGAKDVRVNVGRPTKEGGLAEVFAFTRCSRRQLRRLKALNALPVALRPMTDGIYRAMAWIFKHKGL